MTVLQQSCCPLLLLFVISLSSAGAATGADRPAGFRVQGAAVAFDDGDSFDLRVAGRGVFTVRLHAVDAPELAQPHGEQARQALIDATSGRTVHIDCYKRDARGRHVCRAWAGGRDLQLQLLCDGHVWHFTRYLDEQTAAESSRYAQAAQQARSERRGLWAWSRPMPPWTCRAQLRQRERCR